ncbi:methionyl-tRNA formyltransferase [Sulfuricurvum kujiense DSM 16994]|uniref:Methionyl-tRNA formyltransferase n=1 Tax=Sulfuricurvum kujiense (strain ATCC BAA-921 / DSM 16994 / JCM 11577 / YK-1) TaxID=709032 RepID=E4U1I0_SULKY|nr:methionyl-tRNA formyltransferase [Sulfuricurvum kujiense]ADR33416.1 methionyl-tRNA formyltransferase [Sulfuricurvum kujiense DSM 16994]
MTRVIFMGTPDYAESILEALITADDIEVVAVYTQPDKPVGRKAVLTPPVVKVLAEKANIPVKQPTRLRDEEVVTDLRSIPCDLIIVAAYGQILPKAVLEHAPCINLHASILPQYRGASPIQQSLLNNDSQSGVTAMWMDEGLDTGAIIKIETLEIGADEMVESLYKRLTDSAVRLTLDVIRHWDRRSAIKQNDAEATYCKKILKSDGLIDFSDACEIYNRYRAFTPWPGIFTESGLKIKEMRLEDESSSGEAGVISRIDKEGVVVQCKKGSLKITRVQAPSKQETSVVDYLNGKRIGCGYPLV